MRIVLKRIGIAAAMLLIAVIGYSARQAGHPAPPPASQFLHASRPAPGGVTVQFFGTTTLLFSDGANAVMIDGFVSRPGLWPVLTGKVGSDAGRVNAALTEAGVGHVDLLLVSHSHYDHALDAPAIAKRTGAMLAGSPSTIEIGRGAGLADNGMRAIAGGEVLTAGRFRVTVFRSRHSPDDRVPGMIDAPLAEPARVTQFREGGTFSFLVEHGGERMIVHASANYVSGMYRGIKADTVFLATGGLGAQSPAFAARYWNEVVRATGARLVIPIHWDDFLRPLDVPMLPMRRFMDDFPKAMSKVAPLAARDQVTIRYMPVLAPVDIAAAAHGGQAN